MASNYEVNIKLDTKQAKNQLRELEERITKLNRMALSGKASKQALAVDKEKLKVGNLELKNELAVLKVKQNELKLDKQSFLLEKQKANFAVKPKGGGTGGTGGNQPQGKGIVASALISGSFPLLFGQGIPGALAGGLGGGLGAKFGGQTGGFAGGLVATAALQIFNNVKDSVNQFGAELNDPTENLDALTARIKVFDKSIETSINTLKNAGLDQVAGELASLTMQQQFAGLDSVKDLNNEITKFQQGAADLTTRLSILIAGPLTLLFKTLNLLGGSARKAAEDFTTTELVRQQEKKLETDLATEKSLVDKLAKAEKELARASEGFKIGEEMSARFDVNNLTRALEKTRESIKANERLLEIRKLQRDVLMSEGKVLDGQIELEKLKAEVTRGNTSEKAVAVEQKRLDMLKVENKLLIANANLKSLINDPKATEGEIEAQRVKIANLEKESELVQRIGNERINAADPAISRMDELNRKMRDLNDTAKQAVILSKAMGESFEDSFKGIIKGTMTVADAFRNMLNKVADYFLDAAAQMVAVQFQKGILGLFSNLFNFSTTPLNDIQSTPMLAANGGPVGMRQPYIVGERGPELFVPNQSGNIIPNHDLAGVGGGSTNIVVNVDASGSNVEGDEDEGRALGIALSAAIETELIKQKRPGGLLA